MENAMLEPNDSVQAAVMEDYIVQDGTKDEFTAACITIKENSTIIQDLLSSNTLDDEQPNNIGISPTAELDDISVTSPHHYDESPSPQMSSPEPDRSLTPPPQSPLSTYDPLESQEYTPSKQSRMTNTSPGYQRPASAQCQPWKRPRRITLTPRNHQRLPQIYFPHKPPEYSRFPPGWITLSPSAQILSPTQIKNLSLNSPNKSPHCNLSDSTSFDSISVDPSKHTKIDVSQVYTSSDSDSNDSLQYNHSPQLSTPPRSIRRPRIRQISSSSSVNLNSSDSSDYPIPTKIWVSQVYTPSQHSDPSQSPESPWNPAMSSDYGSRHSLQFESSKYVGSEIQQISDNSSDLFAPNAPKILSHIYMPPPPIESPQSPQDASSEYESPQSPRYESPQSPKYESPQSPECESPQSPECESPQSPECESPQSPECGSPQSPEYKSPQSPEVESPQSSEVKSPQSPDYESPHSPEDESPQSPDYESPHSPEDQSPDYESPHSPEDESLQSPEYESPNSPEEDLPQSPKDESPQSPEDESLRSLEDESSQSLHSERLQSPEISMSPRCDSSRYHSPVSPQMSPPSPQIYRSQSPQNYPCIPPRLFNYSPEYNYRLRESPQYNSPRISDDSLENRALASPQISSPLAQCSETGSPKFSMTSSRISNSSVEYRPSCSPQYSGMGSPVYHPIFSPRISSRSPSPYQADSPIYQPIFSPQYDVSNSWDSPASPVLQHIEADFDLPKSPKYDPLETLRLVTTSPWISTTSLQYNQPEAPRNNPPQITSTGPSEHDESDLPRKDVTESIRYDPLDSLRMITTSPLTSTTSPQYDVTPQPYSPHYHTNNNQNQ